MLCKNFKTKIWYICLTCLTCLTFANLLKRNLVWLRFCQASLICSKAGRLWALRKTLLAAASPAASPAVSQKSPLRRTFYKTTDAVTIILICIFALFHLYSVENTVNAYIYMTTMLSIQKGRKAAQKLDSKMLKANHQTTTPKPLEFLLCQEASQKCLERQNCHSFLFTAACLDGVFYEGGQLFFCSDLVLAPTLHMAHMGYCHHSFPHIFLALKGKAQKGRQGH